jgi:peroxin-1
VRNTDMDLPSRGKTSSEAPRKTLLVHTSHLDTSFRSTRPSVPPSEVARLGRIYAEFSGDRKAIFPDGTPSNQIGARTSLM